MSAAFKTDGRFESAASLLPENIRKCAMALDPEKKLKAEEFRLRSGRPFSVVLSDGEHTVSQNGYIDTLQTVMIFPEDIMMALETATRGSAHTALESVRSGYVTVSEGHRIGICGQAVVKDGELSNIRTPSSLNIRIAREHKGIADTLIPNLLASGCFQNTIILSPPGCGKTTLLRDIVRQLSNGGKPPAFSGLRISLVDERNEIAAQYNGYFKLDVGLHTDVVAGCPKPQAIMMLLRAMSPQVIAIDEITAPEDIKAILSAANCGVKLLATAHADSADDLFMRPLYKTLLEEKLFKYAVVITKNLEKREYELIHIGGEDRCLSS